MKRMQRTVRYSLVMYDSLSQNLNLISFQYKCMYVFPVAVERQLFAIILSLYLLFGTLVQHNSMILLFYKL